MQPLEKADVRPWESSWANTSKKAPAGKIALCGALGFLALGFVMPLTQLMKFAVKDELYSYIPLIPCIVGYLVWMDKKALAGIWEKATTNGVSNGARAIAGFFFVMGVVLAGARAHYYANPVLSPENAFGLSTVSFIALLTAICAWFLGVAGLRLLAFPLAFLLFMAPLPPFVTENIETFLQEASAVTAYALFRISGMPILGDHLVMQLPGISLRVARECSGMHSSLVLFIVSIVAAKIFLRSPWRRILLVAVVLPLAILRNAIRIFTIGQICIRIGPEMIHSYIHQHGGPLFFILSLIPLFLLLVYLHKSERKSLQPVSQ